MTEIEVPVSSAVPRLRYRSDIDGLRAVAVLGVVFYHYGFSQVRGGFAGVDIFFVISGFLITRIIYWEIVERRFSLRHFYERRIKRIFPALFLMLAAATIAAWELLFPVDFEAYAKSLVATAFFSANFEFWREVGYFDIAATQKPLLHLWTIAVEEQFYLLFPAVLLLVATKSRLRLLAVTAMLFVLSLAFSIWAVRHARTTAFYLLPSRFWELMLGALLALIPRPVLPRWAREGLAIAGAASIAWTFWSYRSWMPFPGVAALIPCVATAMLILAGEGESTVSRALSLRPVVFVGLISYSLYLWHWPIFVFTRTALNRALMPWETWACIGLSFALSVLSWYLVEQPARRRIAVPRRVLFAGTIVAMVATASFGAAVASARGVPQRLQPEIRKILAEERNHEPRMDTCFGLTARDVRHGRLCRIGSMDVKRPSFLLWGDSHADALLPAVQKAARDHNRAGLFAATDSCAPLLGVVRPDMRKCKPFNDAVANLALRPQIKEIILDARWGKNAYGTARGEGPGRIHPYDKEGVGTDRASTEAVFYRGLERTMRLLSHAGKKIIIIASVPEAG